MTQLFNPHTMETQVDGARPKRSRATVADVVATKDGYVGFAVVNRVQHWLDFCAMIGRPDWADDRTLDSVATRTERCAELNPVIEAWCGERTTAEIVELAALLRIPCIEVGNGASIPTMDHFASEPFYDVNPDGGFLQPAAPFRMHPPIPGVGEVRPAPPLGPPIRDVAAAAAGAGADAARRAGTAPVRGPACRRLHVVLGRAVPRPRARDVRRRRRARRVDRASRRRPADEPPPADRGAVVGALAVLPRHQHQQARRHPRPVAAGRAALAHRLVADCDVIVENYSPRVMDSFGLSWDDVRAINPQAIMVRMPAFGLTGPWRDRTGFAMTMEQVSGMAWLCGFPEHAPGALFGPCDPGAGLHALTGLLAALEHRRRTGEGRLVECPMVANALNVAGEQVIEHSANGVRLDRTGNRGLAAAPQNSYAASDWDDDLEQHRWVSIAVATDEQWQLLRAGSVIRRGRGAPPSTRWPGGWPPTTSSTVSWPRGAPSARRARSSTSCGARRAVRRRGAPVENLTMEQLATVASSSTVEHPVHGELADRHVPVPTARRRRPRPPPAGAAARRAQRRDPRRPARRPGGRARPAGGRRRHRRRGARLTTALQSADRGGIAAQRRGGAMKRRWVSLGIALGVVASVLPAVAPSASAQTPANGVGTIEWGPCEAGSTLEAFGAECGMLSVPLDYRRPARREDRAGRLAVPAHRAR